MTKDDRINLRISGPQREAWEEAARKADRTLADWIRVTVERICSGQDVALPVDPDQRKKWEVAALKARRTLTDWIRIQLDDAARKQMGNYEQFADNAPTRMYELEDDDEEQQVQRRK